MIQGQPQNDNRNSRRISEPCVDRGIEFSGCKRSLALSAVLSLVLGLASPGWVPAAADGSPVQDAPIQTEDAPTNNEARQVPSPWPEGFPDGPWWNDGLFCGPNALYVLMRLNNVPVTMEEVHSKIEIRPGLGCTPEQLKIAGGELGFDLEERFVLVDQLLDLQRPFILHGAQSEDRDDAKGHYWVVVGYDESSQMFAIVDASSGIYRMIRLAQIEKQFSGWVVVPQVTATNSKLVFFRMAFFCSLFLVAFSAGLLLLVDMRLKRKLAAASTTNSAQEPTND